MSPPPLSPHPPSVLSPSLLPSLLSHFPTSPITSSSTSSTLFSTYVTVLELDLTSKYQTLKSRVLEEPPTFLPNVIHKFPPPCEVPITCNSTFKRLYNSITSMIEGSEIIDANNHLSNFQSLLNLLTLSLSLPFKSLSTEIKSFISCLIKTLTEKCTNYISSNHLFEELHVDKKGYIYPSSLPPYLKSFIKYLTQLDILSLNFSSLTSTHHSLITVDILIAQPIIKRLSELFKGDLNRIERPEYFYKVAEGILEGDDSVSGDVKGLNPVEFLRKYVYPMLPSNINSVSYLLSRILKFQKLRLLKTIKPILERDEIFKKTLFKSYEFENMLKERYGYSGEGICEVFEVGERFDRWYKHELKVGLNRLDNALREKDCWLDYEVYENNPNLTNIDSKVIIKGSVKNLKVFEGIIENLLPQIDTLKTRKSSFIKRIIIEIGMRFYDAIYNLVKGNDLRDTSENKLKETLDLWMSAIQCCNGACGVLKDVEGTEGIIGSFRFLGNAVIEDFCKQIVEIGKRKCSQYLVRSHKLLEKTGLDALSESLEEEEDLSERIIRYEEMVEGVPDVSFDLREGVEFFGKVVEGVRERGGEAKEEIIDSISLEIFRPFLDRIFDAPLIRRSGRRQFCYDVTYLFEIFNDTETSRKLKGSVEILRMEEEEVRGLLEVLESVREAEGEDENEEEEVRDMLAAKGVEGLDVDLAVLLMKKAL
ncbi:hypothetical protein TrLO_g2834 [Triparma laevis f. longispina]|uniref:Uncharacterized protein n=1 Tax=Triparma laevis f. longispina TaxID=1714387 RepID=A0A9W7CK38_9STRA|nr:hypothetical protein TrLO_g2834 [Triparma laevis f. longispina]